MAQSQTIVKSQVGQQNKGLGVDGEPFINKHTGKPEYSKSYARIKGKKRPIDLHDTGDFQRNIKFDVSGDKFKIYSTDEKALKLINQFGVDIFGLNTESKILHKPLLQNELVTQFNLLRK